MTMTIRGWIFGALGLALLSCNEEAKKATANLPRERSEVVQASGAAPSVGAATVPVAVSAAPRPATPRRLCEGQLAKPGRDVPKRPLARKSALGAKTPSAALPTGKWAWINLWAAWCAPCKEEIPRLQGFATRLGQEGRDMNLVFLSLDDDERQLEQFLASQPEQGVRSTYWLREGHERDDWLAGIGLGKDPQLPAQLLVDPHGKVRCSVTGAVEDQDYAEIAAIVASP